ncbi:P-loop containing nucleoside triphosphate hydrolase protein [Dichotomocladium elegans]|nr:P-loop containing nucleoside triphosphate hydrolase protein [Dichotomocladium elegans]
MQDYSSLGITSTSDRKKLFQLVQKLRQDLPTLENGLVSSPMMMNTSATSSPSSLSNTAFPPTATSVVPPTSASPAIPTPSVAIPAPSAPAPASTMSPAPTGLKTPQSYRRRPQDGSFLKNGAGGNGGPPVSSGSANSGSSSGGSGSGIPDASSLRLGRIPQTTASSNITATRSRSRTLPDQAQRPDLKSFRSPPAPSLPVSQPDEYESSDDDEPKCEIRRGSGPLLDPYGVPIVNKRGTQQQRGNNSFAMTPSSLGSSPAGLASGGSAYALQSDLNQKIRVVVRKRPLNKKELDRGEKDISPTAGVRSININEPKMKVDLTKYIEQHSFTYDDVFDHDANNEQVYQRTAAPLVKYIFGGGKATCFAYGQTGSGKTYTMLNPDHGLYVLAARDIFGMLCQPEYQNLTAWIGFYEIYQGHLYDLLNERKKLFAREDGKQNVVIVGLKEYVINNVDDLMQVFKYGSQARSTGSTGANSDSSRSHAILQILLRPAKSRKKIIGKLSFIDLAGSERGADRGDADTKTRMEGAEINKSLLALKECIRALDQDKRHTPFRQSKLTQVLKDSFVGNSRTCMIATISPNQSNSEHTLNTLRYADRVKELKGERDRRVLGDSQGGETSPNARSTGDDLDYGNDDSYHEDYLDYSDDPDLYNEGEDDNLFLDEENFLSDTDVNILDEDFPHENRSFNEPIGNASHRLGYDDCSSSNSPPLQQMRMKPLAEPQQYTPKQRNNLPPPHHQHFAGMLRTSSRPDQQQQAPDQPSFPMRQSPETMAGDLSSEFTRSRHGSVGHSGSLRHQQQQASSSAAAAAAALFGPSSSVGASSSMMYRSQSIPSMNNDMIPAKMSSLQNTTDADDIIFEQRAIEDFIKYHRGEIREVAECSKKETKLLANFSLYMTSLKEGDGHPRPDEDLKMSSEFIDYLDRLDEVLEMKMGAIEALRDRIRRVLGEDDI